MRHNIDSYFVYFCHTNETSFKRIHTEKVALPGWIIVFEWIAWEWFSDSLIIPNLRSNVATYWFNYVTCRKNQEEDEREKNKKQKKPATNAQNVCLKWTDRRRVWYCSYTPLQLTTILINLHFWHNIVFNLFLIRQRK